MDSQQNGSEYQTYESLPGVFRMTAPLIVETVRSLAAAGLHDLVSSSNNIKIQTYLMMKLVGSCPSCSMLNSVGVLKVVSRTVPTLKGSAIHDPEVTLVTTTFLP